jgi:hypothetical protein
MITQYCVRDSLAPTLALCLIDSFIVPNMPKDTLAIAQAHLPAYRYANGGHEDFAGCIPGGSCQGIAQIHFCVQLFA